MPLVSTQLRLHLDAARAAASGFVTWWLAELRSAFEDWVLSRFSAAGMHLYIEVSSAELRVSHQTSGQRQLLLCQPRESQVDLPASISAALQRVKGRIRRADVMLPPEAILVRELVLPAALRPNLRRSLELQLPRLMPLMPDHIYFDFRVIGSSAGTNKINVELAIARRSLVDALAAAVGHRTAVLGDRGESLAAAHPAPFHFLTSTSTPAAPGSAAIRWLTWSAAALIVLICAVAVTRMHLRSVQLEQDLAQARLAATGAQQARDALDGRIKRLNFVAEQAAQPAVSAVLVELTRVLPSDAWLFQFQKDGPSLRIAGEAANASAAAAAISSADMFSDVALKSANAAGAGKGERFDITFRVKSMGPSK